MKQFPILVRAEPGPQPPRTSGLLRAEWLPDGRRLAYVEMEPGGAALIAYDVETGARERLVAPEDLRRPGGGRPVSLAGRQWSVDGKALLLSDTPNGRGRSQGNLYLLRLGTPLRRLTLSDLPQRNARLSPDGTRVGFVRADDLWVLDLAAGAETRLTSTAGPALYNGRFGWVYEEELDLVEGWRWSPDSRTLLFCEVDESRVPVVSVPALDDRHMTPAPQRYPRPGDPNPRVRVGFLPASGGTPRWADLGTDPDYYVAGFQWTPRGDGALIQRLNRRQDRLDLLFADAATGRTRVLFSETDPAWVDARGDVHFVPERDELLWLSDRDGHTHLYLYRLDGTLVRQITRGAWDVVPNVAGLYAHTGYTLHVDHKHRLVYFQAARPRPVDRQLCYAPLDGGESVVITPQAGTHTARFSPASNYFVGGHSTTARPAGLGLHTLGGKLVRALVEPPAVRAGQSRWELFTVPMPDGRVLHGSLLKPQGFDPKRRYPLMLSVYGAPGFQNVQDRYSPGGGPGGPGQEVLLAEVDGRGSGSRGREWHKCVYGQLGVLEAADQVACARHLAGLPFVDGKRIGVMGGSYGGYMALMCLLLGGGIFKLAVAISAVTDWRLYDTLYSERYMGPIAGREAQYDRSAPLARAAEVKGRLLLIHGTQDDNVHFLNAALLAQALQRRGVSFEMMAYPGEGHGIGRSERHMDEMVTDFIRRHL